MYKYGVAEKKGSYENRRRIHHLMWTLASMFYKSVSHPLTAFHFQNSNCFLLSLIPLVYFCNMSSTLPQT